MCQNTEIVLQIINYDISDDLYIHYMQSWDYNKAESLLDAKWKGPYMFNIIFCHIVKLLAMALTNGPRPGKPGHQPDQT